MGLRGRGAVGPTEWLGWKSCSLCGLVAAAGTSTC